MFSWKKKPLASKIATRTVYLKFWCWCFLYTYSQERTRDWIGLLRITEFHIVIICDVSWLQPRPTAQGAAAQRSRSQALGLGTRLSQPRARAIVVSTIVTQSCASAYVWLASYKGLHRFYSISRSWTARRNNYAAKARACSLPHHHLHLLIPVFEWVYLLKSMHGFPFWYVTGLLPTDETAGGIDKEPNNGDPFHIDLNGTYMYYGNNLTEISVRTVRCTRCW